jgi:hypothetical protein
MPSLAVVIAYEALSAGKGRQPLPHRKGNTLQSRAVRFWSKIRPAGTTPDAVRVPGLRVAAPPKAPLRVPRLGTAH